MSERQDTKRAEMAFLAKEYEKNPALFESRTFIEDEETLLEFGIFIPGKDHLGTGTIKFWPEDFIVEEVAEDGSVSSVSGEAQPHDSEGETLYGTLVKCGVSTLEATADLAKALGIKKEQVAYAGIKDKDAITAQRVSVRGSTRAALEAARSPHFFVKDIHAGAGAVGKGQLKGNRFTILSRSPKALAGAAGEAAARALERVDKQGFYNYFYLQRFGTPRLNNYHLAYYILKGDYERAVKDLLSLTSLRELPYFKGIRERMGELFGRWDEILALLEPFPLIFSHERNVVGHLAQHPDDFAGALKTIPDQITLWLYALNSLFFNFKIAEPLMHGKEPPAEVPSFLSPDKRDWQYYENILRKYDLYPVPLHNLRPFPQVQIRHRTTPSKSHAQIFKGEVVPEGMLVEFELGKGQYATTFLSHLFNMTAGVPPQDLPRERMDTKGMLGEEPIAETLKHFESIIEPKGENVFAAFLEKGET